jgi:hypothetical protein
VPDLVIQSGDGVPGRERFAGAEPQATAPLVFKWIAHQDATSIPFATSLIVGQTNPLAPLGTFVENDLYIVAVAVTGQSFSDPGPASITGSGWTQIATPAVAGGIRLSVWAKQAQVGETGIYTVTWPGTGGSAWICWNYGQVMPAGDGSQTDDPAGTPAVAPSALAVGIPNGLLAFWASAATLTLPGGLTSRFNGAVAGGYVFATGDKALSATGPTGDLTATRGTAGAYFTAFQMAMRSFSPTESAFPEFVPIFPPPPVGGTPPAFPPPSIPVPAGPLVGPVIAAAGVPPSVAGIPLIRTVSAWTYAFPDFMVDLVTPPPIFRKNDVPLIGNMPVPQTPTNTQVPTGGMGPPIGPSITPPPITPHAVEPAAAPPPPEPPPPEPPPEADPSLATPPEEPPPEEPPPERRRRRK